MESAVQDGENCVDSADRRRPKRMRFTNMQTERLNAMYSRTTHPSNVQRSMLVRETGLDMTQASLLSLYWHYILKIFPAND